LLTVVNELKNKEKKNEIVNYAQVVSRAAQVDTLTGQ
jgi:hypothetical protein